MYVQNTIFWDVMWYDPTVTSAVDIDTLSISGLVISHSFSNIHLLCVSSKKKNEHTVYVYTYVIKYRNSHILRYPWFIFTRLCSLLNKFCFVHKQLLSISQIFLQSPEIIYLKNQMYICFQNSKFQDLKLWLLLGSHIPIFLFSADIYWWEGGFCR